MPIDLLMIRRRVFENRMQTATDYLESVGGHFASQSERLRSMYEVDCVDASDEQRADIGDFYSDDAHQLAEFERHLHRWHLVAVCSLVEVEFAALAAWAGKKVNALVDYQSFQTREAGFSKALAYLNGLGAGIPQSNELARARDFFLIRNCVVHADGYVSRMRREQDRKNLSAACARICGVTCVIGSDQVAEKPIDIEAEATTEFVRVSREMFQIALSTIRANLHL